MIALVPVLANVGAVAWWKVTGRFALSLALVVAVVVIARLLAPRLLHLIVRTRVREVFLIAALFLCLGMSLLTATLGLSLALGAFLAGIVISESAYSHQVVADILPFRDLFNSLFFISIGMLLDLRAAAAEALLVVLLVAALFFLKALVVLIAVKVRGHSGRVALMTALSLAQVGEFSFVLAGVGRANGLIPDWPLITASAIVTIRDPFSSSPCPRVSRRAERASAGRGAGWGRGGRPRGSTSSSRVTGSTAGTWPRVA
jgi:CPA2 family monovalent cation:H+ antiporter-2